MTNQEAADLLDELVPFSGAWPSFPPPGIREAILRAVIALRIQEFDDYRVDL